MSANDDRTLPFIRLELEWIPTVVESGKPFLGICLGCQLLARALGARVGPHPDGLHEIGYFKLQPTAAGRGLFDAPLYVYEWHGEGFEVPAGGELLAEGEYFVNQAFRYGGTAYGLQFHPEVTSGMMARWTRLAAHRMSLPGAQARDEQLSKHEAHEGAFVAWLESFLERWLGREEEAARPVDAALAVASGD